MKALIIEDNRFKFQDAIEVLKRHDITEYVHFDNCEEALDFVYEPDNIKNIDLVANSFGRCYRMKLQLQLSSSLRRMTI